jgi:hypothetical protein
MPAIVEDRWTADDGQEWTRIEFLAKMEWEGGLEGMVLWGGPGVFPPSMRELAGEIEDALDHDA